MDNLTAQRVWRLPALHVSLTQVLDALTTHFVTTAGASITFVPDDKRDNLLDRSTQVKTQRARALGFHHDGAVVAMIRNPFELRHASTVRAITARFFS